METSEDTNFIFDGIAGRYDYCNRLFSGGMDRLWRKRLVKALELREQSRVLDVCTGTGDVVFDVLRYSPACDITGTDVSEPMVHVAQEKQIMYCAKKWMPKAKIRWQVEDAAKIGFESGSFDAVTCAFGIRNVTNRQAALAQMHRVLKPGGKIGLLEFSVPANKIVRTAYLFYLERVMPFVGSFLLRRTEPLQYLSKSIIKWHYDVDFKSELHAVGFASITCRPLTCGIVSLWIAQKL